MYFGFLSEESTTINDPWSVTLFLNKWTRHMRHLAENKDLLSFTNSPTNNYYTLPQYKIYTACPCQVKQLCVEGGSCRDPGTSWNLDHPKHRRAWS